MPNAPLVPTVRRRRLGTTLKQLRSDAGKTLDEAAAAMGWKGPKLSKIESATQYIRPGEIAALLHVYGISDPEMIAALENLAKDAGKKGWWQTYSGIVSPAYADYISLESDAVRICEWSPLVVPGLLQTAAYARENLAGSTTFRTADEVAALAEVRLARQSVLTRPGQPLEFWAIVHEATFHQRYPTRPLLMRDQLRRLLDTAELPNVTIQVMPLDSTTHPGVAGSFSLVNFPGPTPDVVLLENLSGETYVEGAEASPFAKAFELIRATALSVEDSLARLAQMEEGHKP
jgi:transcriptional regulator with XRE-family HTH domain